ncbi:MAG: hypothetical protein WDN28_26240 [Chthoniobacter sp.]
MLPVDFLVRSYFIRTANLKHFFVAAAALGADRIDCEDDLLLCTSLQQATKYPCVVTRDAGQDTSLACEHLPEPFALWNISRAGRNSSRHRWRTAGGRCAEMRGRMP